MRLLPAPRLSTALTLLALLLGTAGTQAAAGDPSRLPAPFDGWNVEVTPDPDEPQILFVDFDSALLGRRVRNLVWLPDRYARSGEPLPVLYYLHGTVTFTNFEVLPEPEDPAVTRHTFGLDETLDEHSFVVVAPDAGKPWCITCNWVDGLEGEGVQAESHLNQELQPLVEALFRVRSDRGGRGIMGHSMGGGGALIQGFRHPDRYAFVGSSSGTMTVNDDILSTSGVRWLFYNRHQGFGPAATHEIHLRNVNILDLAPQTVGTGLQVVAAIGDACLDPETMDQGACEDADRTDALNWMQEAYQRNLNNDVVASRLVEAGVPLTFVPREGPHRIGTSTFRRYFLDRANAIFASPVPEPAVVTYKSVDRRFSAWGYDVAVERPNAEFLHLLDARTDGRALTLAGTGTVTLTTPAAFSPGRRYEVARTPAGGETVVEEVVADADGRVTIRFELAPPRTVDERRDLVEAGAFPFPQTRIEVRD